MASGHEPGLVIIVHQLLHRPRLITQPMTRAAERSAPPRGVQTARLPDADLDTATPVVGPENGLSVPECAGGATIQDVVTNGADRNGFCLYVCYAFSREKRRVSDRP
jgi:hypothetical protein